MDTFGVGVDRMLMLVVEREEGKGTKDGSHAFVVMTDGISTLA
jgi:hypothetical protein